MLGTGITTDTNTTVRALAVANSGDVLVSGSFTQAGGISASRLAKWSGTGWTSLGTSAANGVNGAVTAVAVAPNGDVYVGGDFAQAGTVAAAHIAKWNGTVWSQLGTGVNANINGSVRALAVAANGDVYAGGGFTIAGGVAANHVAKWNGSAWTPLSSAIANGVGSDVLTLAVGSNGEVYAGGIFTEAGGIAANSVAKWNGTAWISLGSGAANGVKLGVNVLAIAGNGDLYVGGNFTQAGGIAANYIAKWNGTMWTPLGTGTANGVNSVVFSLTVAGNGDVYIGGLFNQAGGLTANYIAKWNGTMWTSLGTGTANGMNAHVNALVMAANGDLYAAGAFTQTGSVPANRVARWNGSTWSTLGTGTNETIYVLSLGLNGKLCAGGFFTTTGDGGKAMANFGIYDPNAPLATTAAKATPAAQLFPNPAHGTATLRLPAGAARLPLALSDALGRLVRQFPAPAGAEAVLDLRGLPAGVYWVRCGALSQRLVVE